MKKNIVSAGLFTFVNLARSSIQLLLLPLHTRFLPPEEYGVVATFTAAATIFLAFNTLGLKSASERSFADPSFFDFPEKSKSLLFTLFSCAAGIASVIALVAGVLLYLFSLSPFWQDWFSYGAFAVVQATLMAPIFLYVEYLRIHLDNKRFLILNGVTIGLTLALNVLFVAILKMGVQGVFLSLVMAYAAGLVMAWRWLFQSGAPFEKAYVAPSLKLGLNLLPHSLCSTVLPLADRYIIVSFAGLEQIGHYSAVNSLCAVLYTIAANMGISFRAQMYRFIRNKDNEGIRSVLETGALLLTLAAVTWVLWAQEIITILMPRAYHEAYALIPILSFRHLLHIGTTFFLAGVLYHKKGGRRVSLISSTSLAVLVSTGCLLTWRWGADGMAWAAVLASAAYLMHSYREARMLTSSVHWPLGTILKPVLLLYAPVAVFVYMTGWQENEGFFLAIKGALFFLILLIGYLWFKTKKTDQIAR